jgi:hypothetical protein
MKGLRVGWLIGAALVIQGCAGAGGAGTESKYTDADRVILGVFSSEDLNCPAYQTKVCAGSSRLNMQCSCEHPHELQMALGYYY